MRLVAASLQRLFASIITILAGLLYITQSLNGLLTKDLAKELTCKVFHTDADRAYVWNGNETHSINLILFNSNSHPFLTCLLKNKVPAAKLVIHIMRPNERKKLARQLNFSVEAIKSDSKFTFNFGYNITDIEEGIMLPITIWIFVAEAKQLIFEGIIVKLGNLPSFSNTSLNHTFVQSYFWNATWEFYKHPCIQGLVLVVPQDIFGVKYGFPLGIGYSSDQLTMLKWENITTGINFNQSLNITFHSGVLMIHNIKELYLLQSGQGVNLMKANFSFEFQEILSISSSSQCIANIDIQWFDVVVLFRLKNSSLAAALGRRPYKTWQHYLLPEWLSQATIVVGIIDIERRIVTLAVNIGQAQKTIIVNFQVKSTGKTLIMESRPAFLDRKLNNPKMRSIGILPAILMRDETEIWLSTDGGYIFKRIYVAENGTKILSVECFESNNTSLFIVTSRNVIIYTASLFKSLKLTRSQECIKRGRLILPFSRGSTAHVVCASDILQQNSKPHVLNVNQDALVIPSTIAHVINDFEMSFRVDFYKGLQQFKQNFENICNIQAYPFVHLCNIGVSGGYSVIRRQNMEIKKFTNCSFELHRSIASLYLINALNLQGRQCSLWRENNIGQTLTILDSRASCWIYWLVNDTTAMANCSKHEIIGLKNHVHPTYSSIIDSRGDESCEKTHMRLLATNTSGFFEVKFNDTAVRAAKLQSYLRIFDVIGSLSVVNKKRYVKFIVSNSIRENEFRYACMIGKVLPQVSSDQSLERPICRYDIQYTGIKSRAIYLDANNEVEFNIHIKVTDREYSMPYIDHIPPIAIQQMQPSHVEVQTKSYWRMKPMYISVLIKQKSITNGTSQLIIYSTTQPTTCKGSLKKITINGMCPPGKHLKFEYPLSYGKQVWLYGNPVDSDDYARIATLPYNYQPPSHLGKAIPLTPNVYNVDPSKPMYRDSYKISRDISEFKQCQGKNSRSQCGCTLDMTISVQPELSDCIQRAYRISVEEKFIPRIYVIEADGRKSPLSFPYCLTEVNNRKDFTMNNKISTNCLSMQKNSSLKFKASGLFHFKVKPTQPVYTFCDLDTYFLVYVASTNLPNPSKNLVRAMTAICFGAVILCTFWLHYYELSPAL